MPDNLKALAMDEQGMNYERHGFRSCVQLALKQEDKSLKGKRQRGSGARNSIHHFRLGAKVYPTPFALAPSTYHITHDAHLS